MPHSGHPSSTMTTRPVWRALAARVSRSSGRKVRGSMTVHSTPSRASSSAAASATQTMRACAISVQSPPARRSAAWPKGTRSSGPPTGPFLA